MCQDSYTRLAISGNYMCTFNEMVAAYSCVLVWSPVPSPSRQQPQAQPFLVMRQSKKFVSPPLTKRLVHVHWLARRLTGVAKTHAQG